MLLEFQPLWVLILVARFDRNKNKDCSTTPGNLVPLFIFYIPPINKIVSLCDPPLILSSAAISDML